jgi:hexosaminidase
MPLRRSIALLAVILAFATAVLPSIAQSTLHLIPIPREVKAAGSVSLASGIQLTCAQPCDPEDSFALSDLQQTLADRHVLTTTSPSAPHIFITRYNTAIGKSTYQESLPTSSPKASAMSAEMAPEGYVILPDLNGSPSNSKDAGIVITAQTSAGIFYALQTVKQLVEGDGPTAVLHIATIRDWPAMRYRGLHDDLSRGPIDTLEFQKHLIHTLAEYKINLYSPYFETTQAYASNPLTDTPGAAISASDARQLVAYAAQFHIMVVPEQEAFGHLRHMLLWEQYADVAETPHGAVLSPSAPGSIPLIHQMFSELAALYPSPFLHIGGDETIDLGTGRSKPDVDARGLAPVYLDFLQKIVTDLQPLHRRILFWGDVAQDAPALLKAMPPSFKNQTIAIAWGYSPNPVGGFPKILRPFTEAGIETWVAPSINNYRQVWPNQQLALQDIQQFTQEGQKIGATGQLNTLWDDDGESLANMNWYGILFGAAAAWQHGESSIPAFQNSFAQVFHGDTSGLLNQAQNELTSAMDMLHQAKVIANTEGTDGLFWVDPWSPDGLIMAAKIRPIDAQVRLHAEKALTLIAQAKAANPTPLREPDAISAMDFGARRIDFLCLKFQLADEMALAYSRAQSTSASGDKKARPSVSSLLSDINGVNGRLQDLTYGYSSLRDGFEQQWLRTYRPANLRPVLERYDFTINLWLSRIDKVRVAQRQWSATRTLMPPTDLGIPAPPTN